MVPPFLPPSLSGPDPLLECYISSCLCPLMSEVLVILLLPGRGKEMHPLPSKKHDRLIFFMAPDSSPAPPWEVAAPSHIPSASLSFTLTPLLGISSFLILHASAKVQELLDFRHHMTALALEGFLSTLLVFLPCGSPSGHPDLARLTVCMQPRPFNWASDCTWSSDEHCWPRVSYHRFLAWEHN